MPKFKEGKPTNYRDMQDTTLRIGDIITAQTGGRAGKAYRVVSPETAKSLDFGFVLDLHGAKTARDFLVTQRWDDPDPDAASQPDPELKDREQAEALAAENESLKKENEELKELIGEVEEVADGLQKDLNETREALKASEDARLKALEELAASELEREALQHTLQHQSSEVNRLKGENQCLQDIVKAQDGTIGKAKEGAATRGLEAYDTGALVEELTRRGFTGHIERHDEYDI